MVEAVAAAVEPGTHPSPGSRFRPGRSGLPAAAGVEAAAEQHKALARAAGRMTPLQCR